jgi:hypothetical protein
MTESGSTEEKLHAALALYNRGDYLGCQQFVDEVYVQANPAEQPLVRAMAMLATAMHLHFHRGGGRGVVNLLQQFLVTLDDQREDRLGVHVAELYDAVEAYLAELKERRKPGASFFDRWLVPRIRYAKLNLKAESPSGFQL